MIVARFSSLTVALPSLLALAVALAVLYPRLAAHQFDPLVFVRYDGFFVLFLAHTLPALIPEAADIPAYRAQRVLLSGIVALVLRLSGREPGLAWDEDLPDTGLWALLAVNLASLALGTLALSLLARRHAIHPVFGVAFGLWVGSLYVLHMGMTELLAYGLVVWSLLFYERGSLASSGAAMALAILAKETAVLFAVALIIPLLLQRRAAVLPFAALSLGPPLAWQLRIASAFGLTGVQAAVLPGYPADNMFPVRAFLEAPQPPALQIAWVLLPAVVAVGWGLWQLGDRVADPAGWALVINGLLVASLPPSSVACLCWSTRIALAVVVALAWAVVRRERSRPALLGTAVFLAPTLIYIASGADAGPLYTGGIEPSARPSEDFPR